MDGAKCGGVAKSKNCQNVFQADAEKFYSQEPVNTDLEHEF